VPNLAVIGHPVAHSRSPMMQTAALMALGLAGEWTYGALDVAPEDFEAEVAELAAAGEYVGVNVTVPYKERALSVADERSEAAQAIGAANTLTFRDGQIVADNTDAGGLLRALPASPRARRALVLGAGGAARAAIWALAQGGAVVDVDLEPRKVDVWNRTTERAERVAVELGGNPQPSPDQSIYGLIVNATTVGLHGEDPFDLLRLDRKVFDSEQVVLDMVYGDEPSRLLSAAQDAGAYVVDGLEMLVQQGALSLAIWLGLPKLDPGVVDAMRKAAYGDTPPIA
jgi:shikimate dehydrogenase